jgi:membrane-associated protease RseP (regulator of RpoE activity)
MMNTILWLFPFVHGVGLGVLAMLLHECGHLLTAQALGVRVKKVSVKWNKGIYTVREQGPVHRNLLISLSGPMVNLLMISAGHSVPLFALANFCYALANMLPIEGSDGYRVAMCWRQIRQGQVHRQ